MMLFKDLFAKFKCLQIYSGIFPVCKSFKQHIYANNKKMYFI